MTIHIKSAIVPNGDLILSISPEEQVQLQALRSELNADGSDTFGEDSTLATIFEWFLANTNYKFIDPASVGALTCAPIIGTETDHGLRAWWFEQYTQIALQDELAIKGRVRFATGD